MVARWSPGPIIDGTNISGTTSGRRAVTSRGDDELYSSLKQVLSDRTGSRRMRSAVGTSSTMSWRIQRPSSHSIGGKVVGAGGSALSCSLYQNSPTRSWYIDTLHRRRQQHLVASISHSRFHTRCKSHPTVTTATS